jgi:protein-S-isoprenylcysteine O-methyltransferase Ste14
MTEPRFYHMLVAVWYVLSAIVFLYLMFVPAPYGRHGRAGWGPTLGARRGWVLMEFPAVAAFALFFLLGWRTVGLATFVFFAMWMTHYVYRTFVFPFRLSPGGRPVPLAVVAMGFFFNIVNCYLNGRWLFSLAPHYALTWLVGPRFLLGAALFFAGFAIHRRADAMLIALRANGQTGYQIPRGFLYERISCPNYFGEMLEWLGWAVATWSPGALAFFVWTVANLLPRALTHHRWYRQTFAEYPPERKAVVPYLL